jgi:hypothetical protein
LGDPNESDRWRERARQLVVNQYDMKECLKRQVHILNEMI